MIERPEFVSESHLKYLDDLRMFGTTNMFGAGKYLQESFGLSRSKANDILAYWMMSFEERHPDE